MYIIINLYYIYIYIHRMILSILTQVSLQHIVLGISAVPRTPFGTYVSFRCKPLGPYLDHTDSQNLCSAFYYNPLKAQLKQFQPVGPTTGHGHGPFRTPCTFWIHWTRRIHRHFKAGGFRFTSGICKMLVPCAPPFARITPKSHANSCPLRPITLSPWVITETLGRHGAP